MLNHEIPEIPASFGGRHVVTCWLNLPRLSKRRCSNTTSFCSICFSISRTSFSRSQPAAQGGKKNNEPRNRKKSERKDVKSHISSSIIYKYLISIYPKSSSKLQSHVSWYVYKCLMGFIWFYVSLGLENALNHTFSFRQILVGGVIPFKKYESQLGWWSPILPIYGKIIQSCSSHHQPVYKSIYM